MDFGDFKAVQLVNERSGKIPPTPQSMDDFNKLITDVEIIEMAYKGTRFTWESRQLGNDTDLSKINRAFCNDQLSEDLFHCLGRY